MTEHIELEEISCISCGVTFWISLSNNKELLKTKRTFYCPNGHSQNYTGKSMDKLKELLERERRETDAIRIDYEKVLQKHSDLTIKVKKLEKKSKEKKK